MTDRMIRAATLGILAVLLIFCSVRMEVTSSITHFLPSGKEAELADLARRLVESDLSRGMVLRVTGDGDRVGAARDLAAFLAAHPDVLRVEGAAEPESAEALFRTYYPRRIYLASDAPESEIPAILEPAALVRRAEDLHARLAGPTSLLFARQGSADPLGLFVGIMDRARAVRPVGVADGTLVLLRTRSSAFDFESQARLLKDIEDQFRQVARQHGTGLTLEQSGVNRFAVAAERSIRHDINFISIASLLGVGALFFAFFRSLRSLAIALLPASLGIAAAATVAVTAFSPVHGVTLGFGLTLIGVAIDYPIHVMSHHALGPAGRTPAETLARLRLSLLMGGGTTALSFVALALSGFPGASDMGLFAAIGISTALATTLVCLPSFLPRDGQALATGTLRTTAAALRRATLALSRWRWAAASVPLLLCAIAVIGVPRVIWHDDPRALSTPDRSLVEEDRRVRSEASGVDMDRFIVAQGATPQAALSLNDRVYAKLQQAIAAGHLEGVRSLHSILWSEDLQRRNLASFQSEADLAERIDAAYRPVGFRAGAFADFAREIERPSAPPLQPADLAGTPLEGLLDASLVTTRNGWAVITFLRGIHDPEAIRESLTGIEGAHYLDQGELLREIFAGYRRSTLRAVVLGSALIFGMLLLRYRRLTSAFLAFTPSVLVALATLGLLGIAGVAVNLLCLVSLLLVVGMGADYGVFALECASDPARMAPTLVGMLASWLTTLLAFGMLALSEHPALRSIGLTTGIGISLAFLASPAVLVLASKRAGR